MEERENREEVGNPVELAAAGVCKGVGPERRISSHCRSIKQFNEFNGRRRIPLTLWRESFYHGYRTSKSNEGSYLTGLQPHINLDYL